MGHCSKNNTNLSRINDLASSPALLSVNGAYCSEKDVEAELGDAEGALMRCGQSLPLLVEGHLGGLYTQSLHCDRPTADLLLQDNPHQDSR